MDTTFVIYIPSDATYEKSIACRPLLGVPLFMRAVLTLADSGVDRVVIIMPLGLRRRIVKEWHKHPKAQTIRPYFIYTPHKEVKREVLDDVLKVGGDKIAFINSNLLFTRSVVDLLNGIKLRKGEAISAAIDRGVPPLTLFLKSDLASILISDAFPSTEGLLASILKKVRPKRLDIDWKKDLFLVTQFTKEGDAIKFLTEHIRRSAIGYVARYINKRISIPISIVLSKMRINPNLISMFNIFAGMSASIGAASRTYRGLLIGATLFQIASILDGCDGEVAKLTYRTSKFGQYIDTISDNLSLLGFFTGLMIHVYRVNNHTPWAFVLGGALLVGIAVLLSIMAYFLRGTGSASLVTFEKKFVLNLPDRYPKWLRFFLRYARWPMKKDSFSLLIFIFGVVGILPAMIYLGLIGVWIGNIIFGYVMFGEMRRKSVHKA